MANAPVRENLGIVGVVTVRQYPLGAIAEIERLHAEGAHDDAQRLFESGKIISRSRNKVLDSTDRGIDILRQWFISGYLNVASYPVGPQWGEIGTGTTNPTTADTGLEAPVARARISYATNSAGIASLQFFFGDALLANGTYHEFMTRIGGDTTLGSGQGMNRVKFGSPYAKTAGNDTTVECDFSLANV